MLIRTLVIGASSGIGRELCRALARQGHDLAVLARREAPLEALCAELSKAHEGRRFLPFVHDVCDLEAAPALFDDIVSGLDGLDMVVYCAGVMPSIGPDEFDTVKDQQIVQVNVLGAMAWLNLAASRFRAMRSGTIVGISSVAGDRGRIGQPAYCASKAAMTTYLEALRNRLSRHGVSVVTIKPGPVHTPMTEGLENLPLAIEAEEAAEQIVRAAGQFGVVRYVPLVWMPIMRVIQSIPSLVFRRLSI